MRFRYPRVSGKMRAPYRFGRKRTSASTMLQAGAIHPEASERVPTWFAILEDITVRAKSPAGPPGHSVRVSSPTCGGGLGRGASWQAQGLGRASPTASGRGCATAASRKPIAHSLPLLPCRREQIAAAPHRADDAGMGGVGLNLTPNAHDSDVNCTVEGLGVAGIGELQQALAGQHSFRVFCERLQQAVF